MLNIGFDGFKGENSMHLVNITESSGEYCAFKECIDTGERKENADFYAELVFEIVEEKCSAARKNIKEIYTEVVVDNVSYNRTDFTILKDKYPSLFFIGCVADAFYLLMEDLVEIDEFKHLLKCARPIAEFVKSHNYVLNALKNIIG